MTVPPVSGKRKRLRGQATIETALLLPWLVLSFVGAYDMGVGSYALISTQSAARAGAVWGSYSSANAASSNFSTKACSYALAELRNAPGVGSGTTSCGGSSPVSVSTSSATGADGQPAVSVTVNYSVSMIPFPGILASRLNCSRTVILTVRS